VIANPGYPQPRTCSAAEKIQFFFEEQAAGCFESQPPSSPGQYRYFPWGSGHSNLIKALTSSGPQLCYYIMEGKKHYFIVFKVGSNGTLIVHAHTPHEASVRVESN